MHIKKEVGVKISKRRCNLGSYKGEVARLHPFFLSDHQIYRYIRVNTLVIALASKDNTMVKPGIYLRRNSE